MAMQYLASWDHVESILRHERINEGRGDRLLAVMERLRSAGFDRQLVARRTWQAPLVLARSTARVISKKDPVVVFVCCDEQVVALIGTSESFKPCPIDEDALPRQLTKALSSLATSI
jgi:hypothetical protein